VSVNQAKKPKKGPRVKHLREPSLEKGSPPFNSDLVFGLTAPIANAENSDVAYLVAVTALQAKLGDSS